MVRWQLYFYFIGTYAVSGGKSCEGIESKVLD